MKTRKDRLERLVTAFEHDLLTMPDGDLLVEYASDLPGLEKVASILTKSTAPKAKRKRQAPSKLRERTGSNTNLHSTDFQRQSRDEARIQATFSEKKRERPTSITRPISKQSGSKKKP